MRKKGGKDISNHFQHLICQHLGIVGWDGLFMPQWRWMHELKKIKGYLLKICTNGLVRVGAPAANWDCVIPS